MHCVFEKYILQMFLKQDWTEVFWYIEAGLIFQPSKFVFNIWYNLSTTKDMLRITHDGASIYWFLDPIKDNTNEAPDPN